MSNDWGRITTYEPTMAKKAAEMFNAFNELWPGGFGGGVPYTEERVHDWLDKTSAIADLIAIDDNDELCGYCGLYPHWRDKNAAYISILGVTPKVKGKKFGKRLLLKSLELAKENGITRVDLHTWSGNMDAVPLYKKVGLFWVPDTSVYMQDFIPGILQQEIAQDWFNKHPDWYGNFVRALDQAPDKHIEDGMELFSYKFQVDEDLLTAEIDRYGWGFTGFERILEGKKIAVKTKVASHEIFTGIENNFKIILHNDYENELEAKINIKEFKGLEWLEKPPKSIKVKKGKTIEISVPFTINKKAALFRDNDRSCEKIETNIKMGDREFNLITSGKIQSPIKLRGITGHRFSSIPRGKEVIIPLDIVNTTKMPIKGTIDILIDNLSKLNINIPFELEAEQISGIEVPITLPVKNNTNQYMIRATPKISINKKVVDTPTYDVPLFVKTDNLIEIVELKDIDRLYLITDKLVIRAQLEGGNIYLYRQENAGSVRLAHQSGPPFGLSLDQTLRYEYEFEKVENYHQLKLIGQSIQIPGLRIEKYFKIAPGMNEVEYWVKYTNTDKDNSIHVSAQTRIGTPGISLNPNSAMGCAFAPINNKIIESDTLTNFLTYPVVPTDPKLWHETWSAVEGLLLQDLQALIWEPSNIEKIELHQGIATFFESITREINPGDDYKPIHFWYSFGYNNIQEVRRRWNQLVGNTTFSKIEELIGPEITKALSIELKGERIFSAGKTHEVNFDLHFVSTYPLQGSIRLNLPKGWSGKFKTENGLEETIPVPEITPFQTIPITAEITIPNNETAQIENIQVHLSGEFEFDFNNYIIISSEGAVNTKPIEIEGRKAIEINNGNLSFLVSSEIGGNLIQLKDKKNRTFLIDGFPKIQPKFFFEEYIGGLQPVIFHLVSDDPFNKLEKTSIEEIADGNWKGAKISWKVEKEKQFLKDQKFDLTYLTLPNSDLVRVIITLDNQTQRLIPWVGTILADVGLGGSKEENVIEVEGARGLWIRNSIKKQFSSQGSFNKPFSRITKGDQSISFIVPKGSYGSSFVADFGIMLINWVLGIQYAEPKSKSTIEFVVMINQPREKLIEICEALKRN